MARKPMEYAGERDAVRELGARIGFGNMMHLASECWGERVIALGHPAGSEFRVGPCRALTVPCGCPVQGECDWCLGCGWLSERARRAKDQAGE